jgi:MYXO-CTERM domain-containing protein
LYDLADFAAAFFSGALVTGAQQLIGSVRDGRREDWVEGKDGESLVETLVAEALPDAVYTLLRRHLPLLLLLVCIVGVGGGGSGALVLAVVVVVVRIRRRRIAVHGGQRQHSLC